MTEPISDLKTMLATLEPRLHEGVYVYSSVPADTDLSAIPVIGMFRESAGITVILSEPDAVAAGFPVLFRARWITLSVSSALNAVGFTSAFSSVLRDAGISCNVVAGAYHDHLFVPVDEAEKAMAVLRDLSQQHQH